MKHKRTQLALVTLTLLLTFFLPAPVAAADNGIVYGDSVPAGTVVNHDVILVGQNVSIDGTVNGNVFILGNQVVINGKVDGSLILIAQNAGISGEVRGTVYALALTLDLSQGGAIGRDLYGATVSLTSGADSQVARHLYAVGLDAGLNGQIGGELHTVLGPIQLYNGLMHLLGFDELTLQLHFETPQPQPVPQGLVPLRHLRLKLLEPLPSFDWGKWGLGLLHFWAVLFVFALLGYWLVRKPLQRSGEPLLAHPWRTLGLGFVVLIVSFNLFVVGLLLIVLIFAIGLGLNLIGLWPVTMALWAVVYAAILLALLGLALFIAYGSKIIVVALVASWLFGFISRRKSVWLDLLALLAGTVVYALLHTLPYAGWVLDILITAAGMGAAWSTYREWNQKPQPALPAKAVPAARAAKPVAAVKAGARRPAPARPAPKKPVRPK
jgi:hypothetical protein